MHGCSFFLSFDVEKDVTTTNTGILTGNLDKIKNAKWLTINYLAFLFSAPDRTRTYTSRNTRS